MRSLRGAALVMVLAACGPGSGDGEAPDSGTSADGGSNTPTENGADAASTDGGTRPDASADAGAACGVNEHVVSHACKACAPGTTRAAGDEP